TMKTLAIAIAAAAGMFLMTSGSAQAGGCGYGGYGYGGYGRSSFYGGGFSGGYGLGYRQTTWHDTSHFHYTPNRIIPHGDHYHVQPGGVYLHRTGHWHY